MDAELDQSTNRQYAEGVSPLTQLREYPMTTQDQRETAATEAVQIRAKRLGAGKHATAWGCLGARNAIKAGESGHRAIEIGMERVMEMMEELDQ